MLAPTTKPVAFVSVTNRASARDFYEGVIGLTHLSEDDFGNFYGFGQSSLLRVTPMPDYQAGPHPVIGWDVPDIREVAAALSGKGVRFTIYEGMGQDELGVWTAPDGKNKVAWFNDPFGNVLSLSQT